MRRLVLALLPVGVALVLCAPVVAQVQMPQNVVGSGGGTLAGASYAISGSTVGQPVIGFMSGPSNTHDIGFWHPAYLLLPVADTEGLAPSSYWLGQNYPNPFNPVTRIRFSVQARSRVTIKVYDVNGREVMMVVDEDLDPGHYTRILDAEGLSSGVYFYQMTACGFVETRKLVLLK